MWPNPKGFESIGFAKTILIKSRCLDASKFPPLNFLYNLQQNLKINSFTGLVIDGSISYPFNDGAKVLLEVQPDDSLLTIAID